MPPRYRAWLDHVFGGPVSSPAGFIDQTNPSFEASNEELIELFTHTMLNAGRDLARYSNEQVNHGLYHIFSNSCSDIAFSVSDKKVPVEKRKRAIASIGHLYSDCFEQRCAPVLSHLDEPGANPLNMVCYMLWDTSPLSYWEGQDNKDLFYEAVVETLNAGLACKNIACLESALHGLGHVQPYYEGRVVATIRDFVRRNPKMRSELRKYAENAAIGYIQ